MNIPLEKDEKTFCLVELIVVELDDYTIGGTAGSRKESNGEAFPIM